eukprot:3848830-Lingulodinium_polyedra.AAC.1
MARVRARARGERTPGSGNGLCYCNVGAWSRLASIGFSAWNLGAAWALLDQSGISGPARRPSP